jgi:hypothetical protein
MARDPKGAWLATLLNTFGDTTGLPAQPVPRGSTTAKLMPNAINFGPAMPGKKYTAHNAKEFKEVADLDADMQMFTEMLVRIGNLQQCSEPGQAAGLVFQRLLDPGARHRQRMTSTVGDLRYSVSGPRARSSGLHGAGCFMFSARKDHPWPSQAKQ